MFYELYLPSAAYCYYVFCNIISGDVELTDVKLKPEALALNSFKLLPMEVKAGFIGSVKLKVFSSLLLLAEIFSLDLLYVMISVT
jgi:hypothetical protein